MATNQDHTFVVTVSGCTPEQAQQVMLERICYEEDYGFDYTIAHKDDTRPKIRTCKCATGEGGVYALDAALACIRLGEPPEHECQVHYGPGERNGIVNERPDGFSAEAWHADSGTSHSRVGRRYVVACQWCRCVFVAGTATAAMRSFRDHEIEMLEGSRK